MTFWLVVLFFGILFVGYMIESVGRDINKEANKDD